MYHLVYKVEVNAKFIVLRIILGGFKCVVLNRLT